MNLFTSGVTGARPLAHEVAGITDAGRGNDTELGHLAKGEVVVPTQVLVENPVLREAIIKALSKEHLTIDQYTVGRAANSINPETGLPEFGFKGIGGFARSITGGGGGGILKMALPIAGAMLLPMLPAALGAASGGFWNTAGGLGQALLTGAGAAGGSLLSGSSGKGALMSGLGSGLGYYAAGQLFGGNPAISGGKEATQALSADQTSKIVNWNAGNAMSAPAASLSGEAAGSAFGSAATNAATSSPMILSPYSYGAPAVSPATSAASGMSIANPTLLESIGSNLMKPTTIGSSIGGNIGSSMGGASDAADLQQKEYEEYVRKMQEQATAGDRTPLTKLSDVPHFGYYLGGSATPNAVTQAPPTYSYPTFSLPYYT